MSRGEAGRRYSQEKYTQSVGAVAAEEPIGELGGMNIEISTGVLLPFIVAGSLFSGELLGSTH